MSRAREVDRIEAIVRRHHYSMARNGCNCGTSSAKDHYRHLATVIVDSYWSDDE